MDNLTIIIIILGTIATLFLSGLAVYLFTSKKTDRDDYDFLFSLMPHKHGRRAYGRVKNVVDGPNGRKKYIVEPMDLSPKTILEGSKVDDINVIVDKDHAVVFARGDHSKEKNITLTLPSKSSELSPAFLTTPYGKWTALFIELQNADITVIKALEGAIEAQAKHVREIKGGEASIELMNMYKEFLEDALQASLSAKKDKSSISPLGFGSPATGG